MTAAEVVADRIAGLSAVQAIVGTRVFLLKLPENEARRSVRVQDIVGTEPMHLRGTSGCRRDLVQVDSYASEDNGTDAYAEARELDEAVHGDGAGSGLCGFSGLVGGSPPVQVDAILPGSVRTDYDPDAIRRVRRTRDYIVLWRP